jgi:hypothetical protein
VTTLLGTGPKLVAAWNDLFGRTPVTVRMGIIPRVPANLLPLLPGQQRVRWVQVKVTNRTREPLLFSVAFRVVSGPAVIDESRSLGEGTVDPRGEKTAVFDPPLQFTRGFDSDVRLEMVTRVVRVAGPKEPLHAETMNVMILGRERFAWDLVDHAGQPLPPEFALASLRGWVNVDESIRQRAEAIRRAAGEPGPEFTTRWWRQCYTVLFRSPDGFRVADEAVKLPANGSIPLRPPAVVLAARRAKPLEAALVLHALREALPRAERRRLVILAAPRDGKPKDQTLLVAWRHRTEWHAVDLRRASAIDFDANLGEATPRARSLLSETGPAFGKLKETGVFMDAPRGIVALDLPRAALHHFNLGER